MPLSYEERKIIEPRALVAARNAGVPIPFGEIAAEEPDFRFNSDSLGIEVSELLKPASSNSGIVPAAEANYRQEITRMAQEQYYTRVAELADAAVQSNKLGKWGREVCPNFALICLNRPVQHATFQQVKSL
jgi:hypothetical protein